MTTLRSELQLRNDREIRAVMLMKVEDVRESLTHLTTLWSDRQPISKGLIDEIAERGEAVREHFHRYEELLVEWTRSLDAVLVSAIERESE